MSSRSLRRSERIQEAMRAADVAQPAIDAFLQAVERVARGESGQLPEAQIDPVASVVNYDELADSGSDDPTLLKQMAVIKLNGGLGTSMGLSGPKSLLPVRSQETFLDFIARQTLQQRQRSGSERPLFLLMNSFNTRAASLDYLEKYTGLANPDGSLDFVQNKVPKLEPETLEPVSWPDDPELEWCPPGHGDLYPSLLGNNRLLDRLLDAGIRYLFVSNSDNLGATADLRLLRYFVEENLSFLMEVAARTESDRKGGHLARRKNDGRLVLRESAQCPPDDIESFQDITRHRYFNTNNLWIQLEHLRDALRSYGGTLPLPLIRNRKNVDPQDPSSPPVLQLESAMGAAIECFDRSSAVLIPRKRFAPVKTTNDLLAVRSDAYETSQEGSVLRLAEARGGQPPQIDLDPKHYKLLDRFEEFFPAGPPSLIDCRSLSVTGPVRFESAVCLRGTVSVSNPSEEERVLRSGTYVDETVEL